MKHSTIYKTLIAIVPLLVLGMYVLFISADSVSDAGLNANSEFVHPQIAGNSSPASAMLRTQPSANGTGQPTLTPTGDNVADSYFHEIFVFESKLKENPSDTLAMRQLGRLLQDGHRMNEAISQYESYLALRSKAKQVWLDLAASRAGDKRWTEAEEGILAMLKVYPGDEAAEYNLGAIAANAGDMKKAEAIWKKLSETASDGTIKAMAQLSLSRVNQNG